MPETSELDSSAGSAAPVAEGSACTSSAAAAAPVVPSQWRVRAVPRLLVGLVLYGIADAMMIRAAIGVDPWTVFALGLSNVTGLGIGALTNLIGLAVLLLWIPLRQRPGLGTVLNVLVLGPVIEIGTLVIPTPDAWWGQALLFTGGLVLLAVASGVYIGAHLGPGPRDGLMTGLHRRYGLPVAVGRTSVEVTVLAIGWLLGGDVGIGTLAFAVLIGPLCGVFLPLLGVRRPERARTHGVAATGRRSPDDGDGAPRRGAGEVRGA